MEKFGIFELLDTLSALTANKTEQPTAPQEESVEQASPSAAPVYGAPTPAERENPNATTPNAQTKNEAAFAAFISRQEEISKRIDRNK